MIFQSKTIEVFGDHDIYVDTLHGKMIEEEEGFYVYEINIDLSNTVNKEITIRVSQFSNNTKLK